MSYRTAAYQASPLYDNDRQSREQIKNKAQDLYSRARLGAQLSRAWARLSNRPDRLGDLPAFRSLRAGRHAGVRAVPIRQIHGSEGRGDDFDARFRPLHDRTRDRWLSIARAMLDGATLPPVELIQVGESYYVRDGHHRISVARALGQEIIDADVTVWREARQAAQEPVAKRNPWGRGLECQLLAC